MNNLYSFNDTVSRFEGFFPDHRKPGDDMFFNYEWIRESSIHSSSSPTNKIGSFPRKHFASSSSSTCQSSIASGNSASDCVVLRTPKTVPASKQEGVPKTITIPSPNKVSPETDMDIDDKDDCLSVGMETVEAVQPPGTPRVERRIFSLPAAHDSSMESNKSSSSSSSSQSQSSHSLFLLHGFKWNGSLSYLDAMSEHASLMSSDSTTSSQHSSSSKPMKDDSSIGSFDVSTTNSAWIEAAATFPEEQEDSDDDDSSDGGGDFVVIQAGTLNHK